MIETPSPRIAVVKPRDPRLFCAAVLEVAQALGLAAAAAAVGRSESLIRQWTDPDTGRIPSFHQAILLDRAFLTATGRTPPLWRFFTERLAAAAVLGDGAPPPLATAVLTAAGALGNLAERVRPGVDGGLLSPLQATDAAMAVAALRRSLHEVDAALGTPPPYPGVAEAPAAFEAPPAQRWRLLLETRHGPVAAALHGPADAVFAVLEALASAVDAGPVFEE